MTATSHDKSIRYAKRKERVVHVSEVDPGRACECRCLDCGEPLIAKKGPTRVHHFAHVAESNCNPTPESLTHRFAKDLIARGRCAFEPRDEVPVNFNGIEACACTCSRWFTGDTSEVEPQLYREDGFIPDVLLSQGSQKLAVEVYFRHPVPEQKIALLKRRYVHAVEVDLSDLPDNVLPAQLRAALSETRRWKWLNNQSGLANDVRCHVAESLKIYVPPNAQLNRQRTPTCSSPQYPHNKIAEAEACVADADDWIRQSIEARSPYQNLSPAMKLALHCRYLELRPKEIPLNLMQTVHGQSLLGKVHCMYWQTWFYAKFCVGTKPVDLLAVEREARVAYPDLRSLRATLQSENGFSPTRQLFYEFLLQLAMQGLVTQRAGPKAWLHSFIPKARTRAEVRELLLTTEK